MASEAGASCCSAPADSKSHELLARLAGLARRYDINDYAASVKIFAMCWRYLLRMSSIRGEASR